ncbi:MAG: GNAT family N-acetyltransferase [Candidatus Symbiothrix sp.]|jgi:hypothetical protein|nr:GNAT family N-acetyltransferase [Candidatus Symbiothrix sp.]
MIEIRRYSESDKKLWDDFIPLSKNGNFLFYRDYMDYHKDRFTDHSLLFLKKNKIIAVLPANVKGAALISHGGLTFGGLIMDKEVRAVEVLEIFELLRDYCKTSGFESVTYKVIPSVFHSYPAEEDLYALFRQDAKLVKREISSVLCVENKLRFSETKRQAVSKCEKNGLQVVEASDFSDYWELLTSVLSKFGVKPVHSLAEINYLQKSFPDHIKLYEARLHGVLLAGIVIYDYNQVVHTQYMANSVEGRNRGALDYVNYVLINEVYSNRKYFSWGISTEQGGTVLNTGLIQQKEMMGGRGIALDTYRIEIECLNSH